MPIDVAAEKARYATLVAEAAKRKTALCNRVFPDCSPACVAGSLNPADHTGFCRVLYGPHVAWMDAGATDRERLCLGGNRCISPWTVVDTPSGARTALEAVVAGSLDVRSWDGASRCTRRASHGILKGIEPMFRLHLDNGLFFDATCKHRVLTTSGWSSIGRLIRTASGPRYWRTGEGSAASYGAGVRRGGEPLRDARETAPVEVPSRGDVPGLHRSSGRPEDAAARRSSRSHASQSGGRLSTTDDPAQIAALCAAFPDPTPYIDARWSVLIRQAERQSRLASGRSPSAPLRRTGPRDETIDCGYSASAFLNAAAGSVLFAPSSHAPLLGGNRIIAIVPLGCQPVLDVSVESTQTYVSAGVVHHNTGKTLTAAYELGCHLSGEYPSWWKGRRFTGPIQAWAAGATTESTRNLVQTELLGPVEAVRKHEWCGLIPPWRIVGVTHKAGGVSDCLDQVWVEHVAADTISQVQAARGERVKSRSTLTFKAFDQGVRAFQGTRGVEVIWLDEEPPADVSTEATLRTMTTNGIVMHTLTPLQGVTEFLQNYFESAELLSPDGTRQPALAILGAMAGSD